MLQSGCAMLYPINCDCGSGLHILALTKRHTLPILKGFEQVHRELFTSSDLYALLFLSLFFFDELALAPLFAM